TLTEDRARKRIKNSLDKFFDWFSWKRNPLDGSLKEVALNSKCELNYQEMAPFCLIEDKIDHIYVSDSIKIKSHTALYRQNNWTDLENTTSDHPALAVKLELQD